MRFGCQHAAHARTESSTKRALYSRYKRTLQRSFTHQDIDRFTALTGDSNPIHSGTGAIVPGLLAASLFPAIIGSAYPGVLYASQELKFRHAIQVCHCADSACEHATSGNTRPRNGKDILQVNTPVTATVEIARISRGLTRWETLVQLPDGAVAVEGRALSFHQKSSSTYTGP